MSDEPASYAFVYVETDIPPGMTIREWRRQRGSVRAKVRHAERAARRQRRRARIVLPVLGHGRVVLPSLWLRLHPFRRAAG